jgi:hypothetical protein
MPFVHSALCGLAALMFPFVGNCTPNNPTLPQAAKVQNPYQQGGFESGMVVLLYKKDYTDMADLNWKLDLLFDRLISLRINSVSLTWPIYTKGVFSSTLEEGAETPSIEAIRLFIRKASVLGFLITLRPIIDEHSIMAQGKYEWRGTIRPSNVDLWFTSYTSLILEYAKLGEAEGANVFVIATELTSMERYADRWRTLIANIRMVFKGKLTYSSNLGVSVNMPWDALDFIGVDAFFPLDTGSKKDATTADMIEAWQPWVSEMKVRSAAIGKPIVFTEIGSASQSNAHTRPWLWMLGNKLDLENQRRYYEAACSVWKPRLQGIYWWDTTIWMMMDDPLKDKTFLPFGKPAEAEIANCYKK